MVGRHQRLLLGSLNSLGTKPPLLEFSLSMRQLAGSSQVNTSTTIPSLGSPVSYRHADLTVFLTVLTPTPYMR